MSVTPALHTNESKSFNFTKSAIEELHYKGRYLDSHKDANGLSLEIRSDSGPKTFRIRKRVNGKPSQVTLGRFPIITIAEARKMAREASALMAKGTDPNQIKKEQRQKAMTLEVAFHLYLDFKNLKLSTIRGYKTSFNNVLISLAKKPVTEISYDDVLKVHRLYSQKSTAEADRAARLLRAIFYYLMDELLDAKGKPLIIANPVKKLFKAKQIHHLDRKTRKVEDDQIKPFFKFFEQMTNDSRPFYQTGADLILVLLFHGTRFGETSKLKWSNIELRYKRFWLTETKNGRRLWLPMNDFTYQLFLRRKKMNMESEYVFPSVNNNDKPISDVKKPLRTLLEETGIKITPHDLRRTFLSLGNRIGLSRYTIKQLSNHSQSSNDVTEGYVTQTADELREPSQKIANRIFSLTGEDTADSDNFLNDLLMSLDTTQKTTLMRKLVGANPAKTG